MSQLVIFFFFFCFVQFQKTLPAITTFVRNASSEKSLKEVLAEKIPVEQENVKAFRKSHGATKVGEVTVDMVRIERTRNEWSSPLHMCDNRITRKLNCVIWSNDWAPACWTHIICRWLELIWLWVAQPFVCTSPLTLINSLGHTHLCSHSGTDMATARSIYASTLILRILFWFDIHWSVWAACTRQRVSDSSTCVYAVWFNGIACHATDRFLWLLYLVGINFNLFNE